MATMIPPQLPKDTNNGEREVFQRLNQAPDTDDWIVLHSLDIRQLQGKNEGEVDFVVIVPRKGVLCIEVKGGSKITVDQGEWHFGNDKNAKTGPFKQLKDNTYGLRKYVINQDDDLEKIFFARVVVFPHFDFYEESSEWVRSDFINHKDFQRPIRTWILETLDKQGEDFATAVMGGPEKWLYVSDKATPLVCETLVELVRPKFEYPIVRRVRNENLEEELAHYTREQCQILDTLASNRQMVFDGPAGTGKTCLAIESARRSAASGENVLLLCYNRLLANWLQSQVVEYSDIYTGSIRAQTIHAFMLEVSGIGVPEGASSNFFDHELPDLALTALINGHENTFDTLIVDEGQDVCKPAFIDVMDVALRQGINGGNLNIFGDFKYQNIFAREDSLTLEQLRDLIPNAPVATLGQNCRNTPDMVDTIDLFTWRDIYTSIRRPRRQECPVRPYKDIQDQHGLLETVLAEFESDNFKGSDIVVLSAKGSGSCASSITGGSWSQKLVPFDQHKEGLIPYTTIQSYKGLEAPAVVVTDIDDMNKDLTRELLYIAMTRATERFVVLVSEQVRKQFLASLA